MEKSAKIQQYSDTIFFSLAKFESLSLTFLKMFLIKLISVYFLFMCSFMFLDSKSLFKWVQPS